MLPSITVSAPAKINLGLKVLPRTGTGYRADGYHSIESLFTTVGLCDSITVSLAEEKGSCTVDCEGMMLPQENTFTCTYKAFCVLTGVTQGVRVSVTKRIPAGGGLGGGSSDGASFMQSLDTLFGAQLSDSDLRGIAGQVGSDVFFFAEALAEQKRTGAAQVPFAAVVTGRGEVVTQVAARNDFAVLLVFPGVFVSTKEAYALVDGAMTRDEHVSSGVSLEGMYRKPVREWFFRNDFTTPVSWQYPQIARALSDVKASGADFADMSGSGSTVFGIFQERARAERALQELAKRWRTMLV